MDIWLDVSQVFKTYVNVKKISFWRPKSSFSIENVREWRNEIETSTSLYDLRRPVGRNSSGQE